MVFNGFQRPFFKGDKSFIKIVPEKSVKFLQVQGVAEQSRIFLVCSGCLSVPVSENQDVCLLRGGVYGCACPRAAALPTCQGIPTLRITARFPFPALALPCPGISSPAPPGCERRQTLPPDAVSSALLLLKELC